MCTTITITAIIILIIIFLAQANVIYFSLIIHIHESQINLWMHFIGRGHMIIIKSMQKQEKLVLWHQINNSTFALPGHRPSKKQFNLSRCNFWGTDCSWSVKSHVDTCRVKLDPGVLKKDIWMNIDISLAPCGVCAGGARACKTFTEERSLIFSGKIKIKLFCDAAVCSFTIKQERKSQLL